MNRRLALAVALFVLSLDASAALAQVGPSPQLPPDFDPTGPNNLDSKKDGIPGVACEADKAPRNVEPVPLP